MDNYKFEKISLEQGLSQSVIYCILQDRYGFMWFATQDGLNKYDGYNFKVFRKNRTGKYSIPDNITRTIFEDREGVLWIGTFNGHLSCYDRNSEQFNNYDINKSNLFPETGYLTSICEDDKGCLWIGTEGAGIIKFDKAKKKFIRIDWKKDFNIVMDPVINCMILSSDNRLWSGTRSNGVFIIDIENHNALNFNEDSEEQSLSNNLVNHIFEDSKQNIFISTAKGFNVLRQKENSFEKYFNDPQDYLSIGDNHLTCACESKEGSIWIGTKNKGLNKLEISEKKFKRYRFEERNQDSLSYDAIWSLYCDDSNVLWIGTLGDGLNKVDCSKKKFYSVSNLKNKSEYESVKDVYSIFGDSFNFLWIGTFNKGLFKMSSYDGGFKKFEHGDLLRTTMSFCEDKLKNIWIGIWGPGLYYYERSSDKFIHFPLNGEDSVYIYTIVLDDKYNCLWIGTHNLGLLKFDLNEKQFVSPSNNSEIKKLLSSLVIKCLLYEGNGNLLIGSLSKGLLKYNSENDGISEVRNDLTGDDYILSIQKDNKNNLWSGYHSGLKKFDNKDKHIVSYTTEDGLPNNIIKSIFEDDYGNLWMSTNNGISKFNPLTESFRNYDVHDGLQSNEFTEGAAFRTKDTFYFGGINGYTYFNPDDIYDNEYLPNIVITNFRIFNKPVIPSEDNPFLQKSISETEEITLSYRESVFSFDFAALIYNNSLKNKYAYMMEGFDKDWIYCGTRRQATYTNLDPGNYVFRVKGSNNDNVWNEAGTSVKINITPPFWKTLWFKGLGAMSIAGAAGLVYKKRIDSIKKEKKSQEEFTKKLIESQEGDRKRIAAELHDSLGQDLSLIKNKALISLKKADTIEKFKEHMNEISELTSTTLNEVREISYNLRPHELDRLGLTKTISSMIDRAANSTNIIFIHDIEIIDRVFAPEVEINIYRIIQECLTNIIKHSEATEVIVVLKKLIKEISISVSDNGKGFDAEKKFSDQERKGFGLRGIPERVKLFGGEFKIESEPGRGTRIRISIPFRR